MNSATDRPGCVVQTVVKIGGSLLEASARPLLEIVCRSNSNVAIVPGGGAFADSVRALQPVLGLTDRAAHHMAILGMQQMALALLDMQPALAAAELEPDFGAVLDAGRVPVWLPDRMTRHDCGVPADWSITSDGLAARLAERLGARRVVLLKARDADLSADLPGLTRDGLIDPAFSNIAGRAGLDWAVVGPGQWSRLPELLTGGPVNSPSPGG